MHCLPWIACGSAYLGSVSINPLSQPMTTTPTIMKMMSPRAFHPLTNHQQQRRTRTRCSSFSPSTSTFAIPPSTALYSITDNNSNDSTTNAVVTGVTLKIAFDTNWAVADASEEKSERFTCERSLDLVHRLRRDSDCVMVGRGTVERDDCTLTVRRVDLLPERDQPVRVVLDPTLSILDSDKSYKMLQDGLSTIIYYSKQATSFTPPPQTSLLTCVDVSSPSNNNNNNNNDNNDERYLSPQKIITDLTQNRNISHIMIEGGPATALPFLRERLVDRAILIRAPVQFIEPVPSHINHDTLLTDAELVLLRSETIDGGDDTVEFWSRPGLDWPLLDNDDKEGREEGGDGLYSWP